MTAAAADSTSPTSLDLDRALAIAAAPAASFARLWQGLWVQPYVSAATLELCRLALARLHRDELEMSATNPHVEPGTLAAAAREAVLRGSLGSSALAAAEQAILEFTECYALDAQSIPDEVADAVKGHLGEAGLVFLIEALGCLDGRIRAARCLRDLARHAGAAGAARG